MDEQALALRARDFSTTFRPASSSTSATATRRSSRAKRSADSRPMPLPAPVDDRAPAFARARIVDLTSNESAGMLLQLVTACVELALLRPQEVDVVRRRTPRRTLRMRRGSPREARDRVAQVSGTRGSSFGRVDVAANGGGGSILSAIPARPAASVAA